MNRSMPSARALPKLPALLLIVAIATGWVQSAAAAGQVNTASGTGATGTSSGSLVLDAARHALRDSGATAASTGFSSVIHRAERGPEPVITTTAKPEPSEARPQPWAEVRSKRLASRPSPPTYAGSNHFWIPSLGMSYRVHQFECTRQRPPDNYIYRWGCAGANNVYILGHAWGVMKPLHDAYVRGRLKVGMVAIYANGNGKVTYYRVTEWRVVDPVESHWAIAAQPRPSMTLQTCVGQDGRYRLNVRLVAFK